MGFAEKFIALRKSREWTQEQLAERLNVSRQSVSKWESGQAMPETEKMIEISKIFNVTVDYLLKPSEIDELSLKTEVLEQRQKQMLDRERKRTRLLKNGLYSAAVYLIFLAVCFILHALYFSLEWEIGIRPLIFALFLITTAIVIFIWAKRSTDTQP